MAIKTVKEKLAGHDAVNSSKKRGVNVMAIVTGKHLLS